jgi:hypothetical protein
MNKRDRQTLLNNFIKDTKEFILFVSLIAVFAVIGFAIHSLTVSSAEQAEQEETVKETVTVKEELVQECISRCPEGMWLGTADAFCRKQVEEKLKNK